MERYHESLVLVGGLAVKYLIQPGPKSQPGAITMDVDLGVALAVEGGQYGSIADDLAGPGFQRNEQGRYVRQFEAMPVFVGFLTEDPTANERGQCRFHRRPGTCFVVAGRGSRLGLRHAANFTFRRGSRLEQLVESLDGKRTSYRAGRGMCTVTRVPLPKVEEIHMVPPSLVVR